MLRSAPGANILLVLVVALLVACWGESELDEPAPSLSVRSEPASLVVVYLIDTLRADHLGVYGYARPTSPLIDAFAREAVVFDAAYAPASWTRASVGSLFTGLVPSKHGAVRRENRLREDVPTLAGALGAAGFSSAGFVSNPNVTETFGFARDFDVYVDAGVDWAEAGAEGVQRPVLEYLATTEGRRFVYVHTIDPHAPYEAPSPFTQRFVTGDPPGKDTSTQDYVSYQMDRYDGEVAYADHAFGIFLDGLRELGLYENALIILMSDHGEEFFDHGSILHGATLYEEQIRVPLLIRFPGARHQGERVATPVRLIDLMPTMLDAVGALVPDGLDGESFLSTVEDGVEQVERALYFEQNLELAALTGLREGHLKLMHRRKPEALAGVQLFDLSSDPGEQVDLAEVRPAVTARLEARLARLDAALGHGLHLEIVNAAGLAARHRLVGRLEVVDGVFSDVRSSEFEAGDTAVVDPEGRSIGISVALRNTPNPTGDLPKILIDIDRIRFDVDPPGAHIRWAASVDDGTLDVMSVVTGEARKPLNVALPWDVAANDASLVLEGPGLRKPHWTRLPHLRVHYVPAPAAQDADIDEALDARLRALGYVEEVEE